jgi:hypothetical protein
LRSTTWRCDGEARFDDAADLADGDEKAASSKGLTIEPRPKSS